MKLEALTLEHCRRLQVQPWQTAHVENLKDEAFLLGLINGSFLSYAVVSRSRVLGIGGVVDQGGGRAQAWTMLADNLGASMIAVVRGCARVLDELDFRRVEIVTHCDFEQAHRMAHMLGFDLEAKLAAWFPDRAAGYLWARIR